MAEEKKYYIRLSHALVEVTQEVYIAYHQERRHARTLAEKDQRNGIVSYDELDAMELITDQDAVSVEDAAIANILRNKLYRCLAQLPQAEQKILYALFFDSVSERELAAKLHITQQTVNYRKKKALAQLKIFLED